jgi:hypothetical protein
MDRVSDHTSGSPVGREPEPEGLPGRETHSLPDGAAAPGQQPGSPARGARIRHALLLVWGAVMVAAVLAGIVGFLVHFFLLQR